MRRCAILGVLTVLLGAPAAQAWEPVPNRKTFTRAQKVAASYFTPKCGPVRLRWRMDLPTWMFAYTTIGGEAGCSVTLSSMSWNWHPDFVCLTMVHEYGHLAGYDHASSRRSIMFPDPVFTPRRCRGKWYRRGEVDPS